MEKQVIETSMSSEEIAVVGKAIKEGRFEK